MKSKMSSFEEFLAKSTALGPEQALPGTVVVVVDKDGICILPDLKIQSKSDFVQALSTLMPLEVNPQTLVPR